MVEVVEASLVIPVLNEAGKDEGRRLKKLIKSIKEQRVVPNEVIFVDGGSTDGTLEILTSEMYSTDGYIKVVRKKGNISVARNHGAEIAVNDVVVFTDAGCVLPEDYVEKMADAVEQVKSNKDVAGIAGAYEVDEEGLNKVQTAINTTIIKPVNNVYDAKFKPSGRSVAVKKKVFKEVGGYPEEMDIGEDTEFGYKVEDEGYYFYRINEGKVKWNIGGETTWETFKIFVKKMFRYGLWDGRNERFNDRAVVMIAGLMVVIAMSIVYGSKFIGSVVAGMMLYFLYYGAKLAWINRKGGLFHYYVVFGTVKRVVYSVGLMVGAVTGRR